MTDTLTSTNPILSIIATTSDRVKELPIKNGQMIFVQNMGRIALDFKDTRKFYNQIIELETEAERLSLTSPSSSYYFVIDSAILWFYKDGWIQITGKPEEIVFIGTDNIPELGQEKKLYVNKTSGNENISVWDDSLNDYIVVSDKTQEVTNEDIENLFK